MDDGLLDLCMKFCLRLTCWAISQYGSTIEEVLSSALKRLSFGLNPKA